MAGLVPWEMWAGGSSTSTTLCGAGPMSGASPEPPESVTSGVAGSRLAAEASLASGLGAAAAASRGSSATSGARVETLVPTGLPAAHAPVHVARPIEKAHGVTAPETQPQLATPLALGRT